MKLPRRQFLRLAGAAAAAPATSRAAFAQAYPSRPVRWVVPFPAGGTTDLLARIMGQWLTERLGQPVVIENRPGGGTNIAVQQVVNSPPDGYTLLLTVTTNVLNLSLYKSLPFDFRRDIVPVSGLAELPLLLMVNPKFPAKTATEFVAHVKANPGKVNVASFGARTISHLAIELLKGATGIDVVHVPYAGGPQIMADLIPGRIEASVDALPNSLPHIRAGAVRALAVLSGRADPDAAGCAHRRRNHRRVRGQRLDRHRCAARYAGRRRRAAQPRDQRWALGPGHAVTLRRRRRGAGPLHAGGGKRPGRKRCRQVGQSDRARRHQAGVMART